MRALAAALASFLLAVPSAAQTPPPPGASDAVHSDSDLSGRTASPRTLKRIRAEGWRRGLDARVFPAVPAPLPAGLALPQGPAGTVSGLLLVTGPDGKDRPARLASVSLAGADGKILASGETSADGTWSLAVPASAAGTFKPRFRLANRYWTFQDPGSRGAAYEWEGPALTLPAPGPVTVGPLRPDPASENGKVGLVHLTFLDALAYFERTGAGLAWWKKTLPVNWPDSADYFSPWDFSLHLTTPQAWDVNLHELGHSVMAQAMRARSAGGQHKIDECYTAALAWSEGWATFLAAAVHLDPSDPDARFEFLVPRRAPIRIENVPDDVCKGETNEWRVAAALWELLDTHADGTDRAALAFGRLWTGWAGKSMGSLSDYWALLKPALTPEEASAAAAALAQNTLPVSGPSTPVALLTDERARALRSVSFDGR